MSEDLYGPLQEKKKKKRKKAGTESSKESSLRDWFGRKGAKGKKKGWVDCNAPDGKGGYKSCGRSSGEKRKKYPACRPTPGACKERGKGKSWGKKAKKKKNEELYMNLDQIIKEEVEAYLNETHSKEHEEELGEIVKELEKASEMHASQAERIQQILDETDDDELKEGKKNCGCGQDPCRTYGVQENIDIDSLDEKKKKKKKKSGKKDACYHKVKSRYKVWPSAYASGALVKCRKVGAKNWGKSKKENLQIMIEDETMQVLEEKKKKKSAKDRMKCNSPRRIRKGEPGHGKKKFVVKACDGGTEKIIRYGDANMEIKKDSPKRRKSFRARHKCDKPGSKLKARYWSCKKW
jgi:hypothetical protein